MKKYNIFYSATCPYCQFKILGNHKEGQTGQMWQHIIDKHVTPPIIVRVKKNELK